MQVSSFVLVHVNLNAKRRITLRFLECISIVDLIRFHLFGSWFCRILCIFYFSFPYITLTYETAKNSASFRFQPVLRNFSPPIFHKYSLLRSSMNTLDCFALFQVWQNCILHKFSIIVSEFQFLMVCDAACNLLIHNYTFFHYNQLQLFLYLLVIGFCVFCKALFFAAFWSGVSLWVWYVLSLDVWYVFLFRDWT